MVSLSASGCCASVFVAQPTAAGWGLGRGGACGAAGRASTPTEPDDGYLTDAGPPEATGAGGGAGGVGAAGGTAGGGAAGKVSTGGASVRAPLPRRRSAGEVAAYSTIPPGGAPLRARTSCTRSAALAVVSPLRQVRTRASTIHTR